MKVDTSNEEMIKKIEELLKKKKNNSYNEDSNIISIIADRGYGKTYLLNEFINNKKETENYYLVEGIINPLKISSDYGIVEIILSKLLDEINNNKEKLDLSQDKKKDLRKTIDEIATKLLNRKKDKDEYLYSGLDSVEKIKKMDVLDEDLKNLIEETIGKSRKLVILIDDFDLIDIEILPQINKDILEFLMIENLQLIVAYNQEQLLEVETIQHLKWYDASLKSEMLEPEMVKTVAEKKLEKIFPLEYKIFLPSLDTILSKPSKEYFENTTLNDNVNNASNKTIEQFLVNKIESKLKIRLESHNDNEMTRYILPTNLRGIIQLNDLLDSFEDGDFNNNIEKFKNIYLYGKVISEIENKKIKEILINFRNTKYNIRNFKLIEDIINYVEKEDSNYKNYDSNSEDVYYIVKWITKPMKAANISIANVYQILKEFNSLYIRDNYQLSFIIKLLYTLDLTLFMNKYIETRSEVELTYYKEIVNGEFIPMNPFNYFHKINYPIYKLEDDKQNENISKYKKYNLSTIVPFTETGYSSLEYNTIFFNHILEEYGKKISAPKTRFPSVEKLYKDEIPEPDLIKDPGEYISSSTKLQNISKTNRWVYNYYKFIIRKDYIDYIIENKKPEEEYLFTNMFDIEYFEMVKYWRSSEKKSLYHMYKIFQNEAYKLKGVEQKINRKDLVVDDSGKNDNEYFSKFYDKTLKIDIKDIKDEVLVDTGKLTVLDYTKEELEKMKAPELKKLLASYGIKNEAGISSSEVKDRALRIKRTSGNVLNYKEEELKKIKLNELKKILEEEKNIIGKNNDEDSLRKIAIEILNDPNN